MLPEVPRKPQKASLPGERRLKRLTSAPCSTCGSGELRALLRTDYVIYFRCEHCLTVWSVAKPGVEEIGA